MMIRDVKDTSNVIIGLVLSIPLVTIVMVSKVVEFMRSKIGLLNRRSLK